VKELAGSCERIGINQHRLKDVAEKLFGRPLPYGRGSVRCKRLVSILSRDRQEAIFRIFHHRLKNLCHPLVQAIRVAPASAAVGM